MIRHITFTSCFMQMKKEGYLHPNGAGMSTAPERNGYVSFEKDWLGDGLFKALYIMKSSMPHFAVTPQDMMALYFNETELMTKGYMLEYSPTTHDFSHKTDLLSLVKTKDMAQEEYDQIGEYVFVYGEIPMNYVVGIDVLNIPRLAGLHLL